MCCQFALINKFYIKFLFDIGVKKYVFCIKGASSSEEPEFETFLFVEPDVICHKTAIGNRHLANSSQTQCPLLAGWGGWQS